MTREEFEYLTTEQAKILIDQNIERDPTEVAFRLRDAAVATQIKNLQKCKTKLPSYHKARCIVPTISYEQSSSEAVAFSKTYKGNLAVDLTCGLGVDSFALSRSFERVIAVEIDPLRADIVRYNFRKLGVGNVEVVCNSAENFMENCDAAIDLIYVDPSRRSDTGRSIYAVEQCSPNVLEMMPQMRKLAKKIVMKLSPLFDVEESFRLFGKGVDCEVISVDNECKEVVVSVGSESRDSIIVTAIRNDEVARFVFHKEQIADRFAHDDIDPKFLFVPDVGFYKSRTVSAMMGNEKHVFEGGYVITQNRPENLCGSLYSILEIMAYQPKVLKKRFSQAVIHLRNFPYTLQQIGIKQGGSQHLFMSRYKGEPTVFIVDKKM